MSGRHEPSSSATFWISLSTAVLRAGLVVAAVVLGIFVLSKAFPSAEDVPPPTSDTAVSPEDTATETDTGEPQDGGNGGQNQPPQTPDVKGIEVAVLNGAGITDLASCVADQVVKDLGFKVGEVGNADSEYEVTTIFFTKKNRDAAQFLRDEGFPDADLRSASSGAFTDISLNLGPDAARGPCENPA